MSEYSSQDLKDVWAEVLKVFNDRDTGCTPRDVAAATPTLRTLNISAT